MDVYIGPYTQGKLAAMIKIVRGKTELFIRIFNLRYPLIAKHQDGFLNHVDHLNGIQCYRRYRASGQCYTKNKSKNLSAVIEISYCTYLGPISYE